ncbi:MAG: SGNH/GDSL hydrolase family protein [Gammaproteobacteria bacterium]|nr:SGNH/GDSL hydrolase family protein [Gammaproteobacteria bacterium]NNM20005.1 SGNH/GDSL hydrolase family protein [Gammaproteobacteria bacterium]
MPATANNQKRNIVFTLVAWALPLILLMLLEGGLRIGGFGDSYDLFVPLEPKPQYLQPNPRVIERFFSNPNNAPDVSIDTSYFLAEKPENGLRIVIQGGSSAAGFPYGKNGSLAGMLQQRLARSFPAHTVEVILTAMSAVNSYTLLDFADEIIAQQPDAVIIYAGHNEYLGILGVGSSFGGNSSPEFTRFFLRLRELRLFRLMQRVVGLLTPTPQKRSGTLMASVAAERSIELKSEQFRQGVEQFRGNLDALLAQYRAAGIPAFVGTLASNEKDQPPFIGGPDDDDQRWRQAVATIETQLQAADFGAAAASARQLAADFPAMATAHFLIGRAEYGLDNFTAARQAFVVARDLDRLRFRAPQVFEEVIRASAAANNATIVEVEQAFATASPHGIIGSELMLEHLHPNTEGYFVLGNVYFDALRDTGLGLDWSRALPEKTARAEQPISRIEQLQGHYRVQGLLHDWPFVPERQPWQLPLPAGREQEIAQAWYRSEIDWIQAMNHGLVHYQQTGDYAEAARVAVNIADSFPFEAQPQHVAGMMLVRQTPPQGHRAIPYFHRAVRLEPRSVPFMVTLARAYHINGYKDAARDTARRLQQLSPQNEIALQILGGPQVN